MHQPEAYYLIKAESTQEPDEPDLYNEIVQVCKN